MIYGAAVSCTFLMLTRLSTFASKTPALAGVLLIGLHYTAFRDVIREDSRQTTPLRGVTPRKKFAIEANVESRLRLGKLALNLKISILVPCAIDGKTTVLILSTSKKLAIGDFPFREILGV